jgi:carboxy-cis,cis-muconate cyclase
MMESNIQNYEYSPGSAIHGMVFDPTETYLYSADMWGNKIWTHEKDGQSGKLSLVGSVDAPASGDHPRWVELHPQGTYLYVLMEAGNNLAVYVIDQHTHMPVFTQLTYPLIPPGMHSQLTENQSKLANDSFPRSGPKALSRGCGLPLT